MPVVEDVGAGLLQVVARLHFAQEAFVDLDLVLADDGAFSRVDTRQLVEPLALADLLELEAGFRVRAQNASEQVLALWRQDFGDIVFAGHDLLVEFAGVGVLEGQVPAEHGVEDDPAGP